MRDRQKPVQAYKTCAGFWTCTGRIWNSTGRQAGYFFPRKMDRATGRQVFCLSTGSVDRSGCRAQERLTFLQIVTVFLGSEDSSSTEDESQESSKYSSPARSRRQRTRSRSRSRSRSKSKRSKKDRKRSTRSRSRSISKSSRSDRDYKHKKQREKKSRRHWIGKDLILSKYSTVGSYLS